MKNFTIKRATGNPLQIFILLFLILSVSQLFAIVGPITVTVVPDTSNNYAEYRIQTATGNAAADRLVAGVDSIYVRFDSTTGVPSSISASLISVNSEPLGSAPRIDGQLIAMEVPTDINGRGDTIWVNISASAQIRNPSTPGTDTLYVWTTGQHDGTPRASYGYSIYPTSSTVSAASVTPNPSIADEAASYTIGFDVGSGGLLSANMSTITVAFDTITTVPNGSLSGVTINSTSATAVASNDTVVITTPVEIDNNGSITVNFASGSGLRNPSIDSTYVLWVKTSTETTFVQSDSFTISPLGQLSISAISSKPDTVNQGGQFSFDVRTGSFGALTANTDSFIVIFQQNTYLPASISTDNVTITSGGFSNNAYAVSVAKTDIADEDTVFIVTPIPIGNSVDVTITFSNSAGYLNPSVSGNYSLKLATSAERTHVSSNPFSVFPTTTTVSEALITPTDSDEDAVTSYTVDFDLGLLGRLKPGVSTITLMFESEYALSTTTGDYDSTYITIAGGTPIQIDASTQLTVNNTTKTMIFTLPSTAVTSNNDNIVLFIGDNVSGTQPITNPSTLRNYQIGVKTSVENSNVNSSSYSIGGTPILLGSITRGDSTVNRASSYDFYLRLQNQLRPQGGDYVKIIFPSGTVLPAEIDQDSILIDGNPAEYPVDIDVATRTIKAYVTQTVNTSSFKHIVINGGVNIINPIVPSVSYYRYTLSTSQDKKLVTSDPYEMVGGPLQPTQVTATANPTVVNASNVIYTIGFTTSAYGKLAGGTSAGSSTITIDFDTATVVPASIAAANVEVNSNPCQTVTVDTVGQGGTVTVTVPNGVTIGNSSSATVLFKSALGFSNASTPGTYNIRVRTASDTVYSDTTGTSGDYTLSAFQALSISSVTPSPATQNANASYSLALTLGSSGALDASDSIRIRFPSNTFLPASMSTSDVTVNGSNPGFNPTIENDTLTIRVPNALSDLASVSILINQAAGILNPTLVQGYTLEVMTSAEGGPITSPSYNITQTSSTVSAADVTPYPVTPGSGAQYTVAFNVGTNGRLLAGTSTITVTFNTSTTVSPTNTNYDSTYIFADGAYTQIDTANISISGRSITLAVPSGVSITNNEAVSVILNRTGVPKPITNPSTAGDYGLWVKTSVEPGGGSDGVPSNSYTITSASAVTGIRAVVTPNIVNAASSDTISFRIQNQLTGGSGTITITFPFNTLIPTSISNSTVRIAYDGSNPISFGNISSVVTNAATREVTITVLNTISANDSVRVAFQTAAGIENPSISGSYTLNVRTSSQNINGTSASYTLQPTTTTILNLQLTITPVAPGPGVDGHYEYSFTTGSRGRLVSGISQIFLLIPDDATFTAGVPSVTRVRINGTSADALQLLTRSGTAPDTLIATVPSSVTIGNSANVTVVIDSTAGLQNATTTASLTYEVYTSVETASVSRDFSLPVELTVFASDSRDGRVYLEWTTKSELENAYWMIQRKELTEEEYHTIQQGKVRIENVGGSFETIEYIDGKGSISIETQYTFVDSLVTSDNIYAYRLADVSFSGAINFHEVIYQKVKAPLAYTLFQNYPNPFNPSTTIKYNLPVDSRVELKVFNILGQKIITLEDNIKKSGFHYAQWNGVNQVGEQVASGIYFVYFNAEGTAANMQFHKVMKIILLK